MRNRASAIPLLWVLALTAAFAIPFRSVPWAFGDVYEVLLTADRVGWRATVVRAFTAGVEYRPFFTLLVKLLYSLAGLHLWFYKALVLLQFALILGVLVTILRPDTTRRAMAALLAVSCVAGLHSSRILFSFFPVNHHSLVILLLLVAATLALNSSHPATDWLLCAITLVALFLLEFGLLIPPVLTVLWLARARGATPRAVAGSWIVFALYVAVRWGIGMQGEFGMAHAETGIGFSMMELKEVERTFGHMPLVFWAYNVAANVLTVLVSEPRNGIYIFVRSLTRGTAPLWMWTHVISSVVTTAAIIWAFARGPVDSRDRQVVALGLALLAFGGGLGFLYARDRIALPVGLGYAILLYVAVARLLERPPTHGSLRAAFTVTLVVMATGWLTRDAEAWCQIRDTVWERHLEWTDRFEELGGFKKEQSPLLDRLRVDAMSMTGDSPRRDARWTYAVFERKATD